MATGSRRVVEGTEANINALSGRIAKGLKVFKDAALLQRRVDYFNSLYEKQQAELSG